MPVILPPESWGAWMDPKTPTATAIELLRPCPPEWMEAYAVSSRVGNVQNDDPELIAPLAM